MIVKYYMENGLPAICKVNNIFFKDNQIIMWIDGDNFTCLVAQCDDEIEYKRIINDLFFEKFCIISDNYKFKISDASTNLL